MDYFQHGNFEVFGEQDQALYQACQAHIAPFNRKIEAITGVKNTFATAHEKIKDFGLDHSQQLIWNQSEGQINTGKMMQQLLKLAREKGIEIYNGLSIEAIEETAHCVQVKTTQGWSFHSQQVIVATNGFAQPSISYRLGIANLLDLENELIRAVWRGVHDGRAAVRHFRKSVEEDGNPWGIDPERIYMGGVSAGGFLALHHAYVDNESEIPSVIDQSQPGMGGGLEGASGNPGYSSDVAGIFNVSGALKDADWMQAGDAPLVSVHGTADGTVPYGTGSVALLGFNVTEVDGSATLHEQAEEIGLTHCFVTIDGAGHVPHVTNADAYDVTLSTVAGALSSWICASYPNQCGAYDYTSDIREQVATAVRMYPNPATGGQVTLSHSASAGEWTAFIRDAQGRVISEHSASGPQSTLDVSALPSGLYVIEVADWGWRQRLIVR